MLKGYKQWQIARKTAKGLKKNTSKRGREKRREWGRKGERKAPFALERTSHLPGKKCHKARQGDRPAMTHRVAPLENPGRAWVPGMHAQGEKIHEQVDQRRVGGHSPRWEEYRGTHN